MGYSTDFQGEFEISPILSPAHRNYLCAFSSSRRVKRDEAKTSLLADSVRLAANLDAGEEGGYYVADQESSIETGLLDANSPPKGQPGLWCQWIPNHNGDALVWDEGEKFYEYIDWLKYLIVHFLKPWGYTLNGTVRWRGEDFNDIGAIFVADNEVTSRYLGNL